MILQLLKKAQCFPKLNKFNFILIRFKTSLRPYQQECIESVLDTLSRNKRSAVSLPTGSGKTRVFSHILNKVKCIYDEDTNFRTKSLVVVNRQEILDQAISSIVGQTGLKVGKIHKQDAPSQDDDVVVATYQTLANPNRLSLLNKHEFKLIIIDEAHHSAASSYNLILEHFDAIGEPILPERVETEDSDAGIIFEESDVDLMRADNLNRRVHVVGFSATFWRHDKKILASVFDELSYHKSMESLVESGFLCRGLLTSISCGEIGREYFNEKGEIRVGDFFTSDRGVQMVFDAYAANADVRKHTVIFGSNLEHVQRLSEYFRMMGVDARIMSSKMSKKNRHELLTAFKEKEFPVLLNCQILTEGTDIPIIDQVIVARGIKSRGMFMQMVGRGLRLSEGKQDCHIVIFKEFHTFKGGFFPKLFREASIVQQGDNRPPPDERDKKPGPPVDYTKLLVNNEGHFSFNMVTESSYSPNSVAESLFHWVTASRGHYLFPLRANFHYKIMRENKFYVCKRTTKYPNFYQTSVIIKSDTLAETLKQADLMIKESKYAMGALKMASWRQLPVTTKQQDILKDVFKKIDLEIEPRRGLASDLISLKLLGVKLTRELVENLKS